MLGGTPTLPPGSVRPRCKLCNQLLTAFFQTELPSGLESVFEQGSRLTVFACPTHDGVPGHPYTGRAESPPPGRLPERFWEDNDGHYALYLVRQAFDVMAHPSDGRITPVALAVEIVEEDAEPELGFKMGGMPALLDEPIAFDCACGAPMALVCQLPADLEIPIEPEAPRQPNGRSNDTYVLFEGLPTYLFACANQCDPRAVLPLVRR